ncbi:MAG TPA: MFS transporter [Mycobacteriales bacterium]|nr:MFS transporter [Mycobacteriales bacterium]
MTTIGTLAPLRHAPFRWLMAGRTISMLGNAVAPIALGFAVLDLTGSLRDLGLVVGAKSAASVVFLLAGGVIADRLPRRLVLAAASALAAVTQGLAAAAVFTGTATIPLLTVLALANGTVAAFTLPASSALLPQTVPPEIRRQANAINRLGFNGAMISGAAAGGALVAVAGPGWGLAVDATTFALAAGCFALLRVSDVRHPAGARRRVLVDLREGWTEFAGHTWIWVVVLGFMVLNAVFAGAILVLGPAVADETFGRAGWGLVLAAQTAGAVLGAVIALRLRVRRLLLVGVASVASELLLVLGLALTPRVAVLLAAALLTGIGIELFAITWETTVQEHVPADKLARVYSYDALGSLLAVPVGQLAAGPAALAIGTEAALLAGAGLIGLAVVGMLASPDVRRLEHHPAPPATSPDQKTHAR